MMMYLPGLGLNVFRFPHSFPVFSKNLQRSVCDGGGKESVIRAIPFFERSFSRWKIGKRLQTVLSNGSHYTNTIIHIIQNHHS